MDATIVSRLLELCVACLSLDPTQRPSTRALRDAMQREQLKAIEAAAAGSSPRALSPGHHNAGGFLVPRPGYLERLRLSVTLQPVTVLHDPPGIGKSVLVRQYAESFLDEYCCVLEAWGPSVAAVLEDLYDAVNLIFVPMLSRSVAPLDFHSFRDDLRAAAASLATFLHKGRVHRPILVVWMASRT